MTQHVGPAHCRLSHPHCRLRRAAHLSRQPVRKSIGTERTRIPLPQPGYRRALHTRRRTAKDLTFQTKPRVFGTVETRGDSRLPNFSAHRCKALHVGANGSTIRDLGMPGRAGNAIQARRIEDTVDGERIPTITSGGAAMTLREGCCLTNNAGSAMRSESATPNGVIPRPIRRDPSSGSSARSTKGSGHGFADAGPSVFELLW